ncbi:RimK/LysX family protein [Orbaceae bacterium ac157xtp]
MLDHNQLAGSSHTMQLVRKLSVMLLLAVITMNAQAKNIYGLHEKVILTEINNTQVKAKLDTGAHTSSLGAKILGYFKKDGKEWIRFKPQIKDLDLPVIEKPIIRYSNIKLRAADIVDSSDKLHTQRPVVMMNLFFAGKDYEIEVNLTDRSRFNYPLLLGSSALIEFGAIVDPSLKYVANHHYNNNF